ncbi:polyhomeotic-like protein 3 isoform X2 [Brachyhypopomus gauderio]|uniref:polyhomeotic-like protein 3 isoform X2 n=1 Tax=Brachyhypopomus gauderio TaxID=698409 RepID=UPI004041ECFA
MEKNNSEVTPGIFTTTTTSSAPISSPVPNMFTRTQASPTPISSPSSDRLAVQVIQQAIPKPASVTTQYLQQVYAAQQHHIMVHTTAVHKHPQPTTLTTHGPACVQQQVSQSNSRQSKSPTTACNENAAQTSPISQFQATNSSGSAGATSQHAMLLGNSSPPGSQAQMYLRTQMLILAPAASVSAELPALTSVSSQPGSSQHIPQMLDSFEIWGIWRVRQHLKHFVVFLQPFRNSVVVC